MSSYFSPSFLLLFLPLSVATYAVFPHKARWVVLLLFSWLFAWVISGTLVLFLLGAILVTYFSGLGIQFMFDWRDGELEREDVDRRTVRELGSRRARLFLVIGLVGLFGILVALKYLGFLGATLSSFLALAGMQVELVPPAIGAPIGISFYTLMAASYLLDIYKGKIRADRHLGRVALYMSFFPQIMEGPFCRYGQTAEALAEGSPINVANLYQGMLRIFVGIAKKMVVADRLDLFVKPVFNDYASYNGSVVAMAAVLYTLQLYFDFSGCMDVAIGIGRVFNVSVPENFRQPFFSKTASEFWQRWHITLGAWFKDYVYYPITFSGGIKRLTRKARKRFGSLYGSLLMGSVALFCVWLGNGLWHGAGSQYVFFGMYYFVLIFLGGLIDPAAQKLASAIGVNRDCAPYRAFRIVRTWVVVFVGELFFRASDLASGIAMLRSICTDFVMASFTDGTMFDVGMDRQDFLIVAIVVLVSFVIGILKERGFDGIGAAWRAATPLRWAIPFAVAIFAIVFGAYGVGYVPVDPMYAQF